MNRDELAKAGYDPDKTQMLAGLNQTDLINIPYIAPTTGETAVAFGCDQDWYGSHWQRQAGCGPCTSATLLLYLARSRTSYERLYPQTVQDQAFFTTFMDHIWTYVTPGHMGVNEASMLVNGIVKYAATCSVFLEAATFPIPGQKNRRKPLESFQEFVCEGLRQDSPVAFLNLSNGGLTNLDSWHWIAITALYLHDGEKLLAEVSDSGERKLIDLAYWYNSSRLGGAAVYFLPVAESDIAASEIAESGITASDAAGSDAVAAPATQVQRTSQ